MLRVWQVLHYSMYLCAGIWEWCRAGVPFDTGFSRQAVLRHLADAWSVVCKKVRTAAFLCVYIPYAMVMLTIGLFFVFGGLALILFAYFLYGVVCLSITAACELPVLVLGEGSKCAKGIVKLLKAHFCRLCRF